MVLIYRRGKIYKKTDLFFIYFYDIHRNISSQSFHCIDQYRHHHCSIGISRLTNQVCHINHFVASLTNRHNPKESQHHAAQHNSGSRTHSQPHRSTQHRQDTAQAIESGQNPRILYALRCLGCCLAYRLQLVGPGNLTPSKRWHHNKCVVIHRLRHCIDSSFCCFLDH